MEEQKNQILEKACDLYCQFGVRSVTMDDVARELGISKKTLYNFFVNKKDLVEKSLRWRMANPAFSFQSPHLKGLNAIDKYLEFSSFVAEMLRNVNKSLDYDLKKYYSNLWEELNRIKFARFCNEIQSNLKQGIKEGLFRPDLNVDFISRMLVNFYLNFWKTEYNVFSMEEIRNGELNYEHTRYHLRGICTPRGTKYLEHKFKYKNTQ